MSVLAGTLFSASSYFKVLPLYIVANVLYILAIFSLVYSVRLAARERKLR